MLSYLNYINSILKEPSKIVIAFIILFLLIQGVGELLEFKGKIVPEFMKIRKMIHRRKEERETIKKTSEMLTQVSGLLADVRQHYDADNIQKRDTWIETVNKKLHDNDATLVELKSKIDETFDISLSLLIENQRNTILSFASRITSGDTNVTHEEFRRIMALYEDYEKTIERFNKTNGQIEIAYRIISEDYAQRLSQQDFIEDIRGYNA